MEGHCCIVPSEHIASCRTADSDTWTEMRNFKKSLVMMFRSQARAVLGPSCGCLALGHCSSQMWAVMPPCLLHLAPRS